MDGRTDGQTDGSVCPAVRREETEDKVDDEVSYVESCRLEFSWMKESKNERRQEESRELPVPHNQKGFRPRQGGRLYYGHVAS